MPPSTFGARQPALQGRKNLIDVWQFPDGVDLNPFDDTLRVDEDVGPAGETVVFHKHAIVLRDLAQRPEIANKGGVFNR